MNLIKTFMIVASAAICSIGSNPVKGQMMVRIAGNGTCGHTGNGGPAKAAELCGPWGVGVDTVGNVFFGDWYANTMRKISTSGIISNFAGNGTNIAPTGVTGGKADTASVGGVWTITFDSKGNLYFNEDRVYLRKIATDGTLTTITGFGGAYPGDGHPATESNVFVPGSFVVDKSGNIFFGDASSGNAVIRKIDASGIMTTIAGGGTDTTGEGVSAMTVAMTPAGIAVDNSGNIYYSDLSIFGRRRIRKITTGGTVTTVLGLGTDTANGVTTANTAYYPAYNADLAFSPSGELYYAETNKIRKISKTGIVTTVAGTGGAGFTGDSVVAATSLVNGVNNIGFDKAGNLYFCDEGNEAVWKVIFSTEEVNNAISYNHVTISPNPGTGVFSLNMGGVTTNAKIVISNAMGQIVYNSSISAPQTRIDISSQPSGIYFARIMTTDGNMITTQKLVKLQ